MVNCGAATHKETKLKFLKLNLKYPQMMRQTIKQIDGHYTGCTNKMLPCPKESSFYLNQNKHLGIGLVIR